MKRIYTVLLSLLTIGGIVSVGHAQHSFELLPNSYILKHTTIPFVAPKTYVPMGSHESTLANETLANFNSQAIDGSGSLVSGDFTTFRLPDTSVQTGGNPPASDGTYIGNQLMEYFTSTLSTIYLDSVIVGLQLDTVPVKLTSYVFEDTVNQNGVPVPYVQATPLASSQLLKSALHFDDTIRFYTIKYNHKLLKNSASVDPQSFFVSISSLALTGSNPFFANPPTSKNRFTVLSDFFPEAQRNFDQTTDKMYQSRTRLDGQWVSYGAVAGLPVDTVNGTFLYPNLIMWAFVSDGKSSVADDKLSGNALAQNYPNPVNAQSEINYSIANEGKVSLKVYNQLGVEVASLADSYESAGTHQATFNADRLPSGTYYYTLRVGDFSQTRQMIVSK